MTNFLLKFKWLKGRRYSALLIGLLLLSILLSTILPQKHALSPIEYFRFRKEHPWIEHFINVLGLNRIITTWWFLVLVIITFLNTLFSIGVRWKAALRQFHDVSLPGSPVIERLEHSVSLNVHKPVDEGVASTIAKYLLNSGFRVFRKNSSLVGVKHRLGFFNTIIFHLSILIIIVGASVSSLLHYSSFIEMAEEQMFGSHLPFINEKKGILKITPEFDFTFRLDRVSVEYYPRTKFVKEYSSKVTVFREGEIPYTKYIRMNHPLSISGFHFYQSKFWGYSARFKIKDEKSGSVSTPGYVNFPFKKEYSSPISQGFIPPGINKKLYVILDPQEKEKVLIKTPGLEKYQPLTEGEDIRLLDNYHLVFDKIIRWTVFYINRDPGSSIVISGYVLAVVSVFSFVFLKPRKIFVTSSEGTIKLAGRNFSRLHDFHDEFNKIVEELRGILTHET